MSKYAQCQLPMNTKVKRIPKQPSLVIREGVGGPSFTVSVTSTSVVPLLVPCHLSQTAGSNARESRAHMKRPIGQLSRLRTHFRTRTHTRCAHHPAFNFCYCCLSSIFIDKLSQQSSHRQHQEYSKRNTPHRLRGL